MTTLVSDEETPAWHIVGDSHLGAFRHAARCGLISRPCRFTEVGGATAVGLRNPNSYSDALGAFRRALVPPDRKAVPVLHLGEVDCGFVIWYRAEKYGESVGQQVLASIDAYFGFVDELWRAGCAEPVITGATLPTIRDGQDWGEVANKRREITTTLLERTKLTLSYNARLRAEAESRRLPFVDIADALLDPVTGVIADRFRHPDPKDHHLDPGKAGSLWAARLNALGL